MDSPSTSQPARSCAIVSTNFGRGAREVPPAGGHSISRPAALARFIAQPNPAPDAILHPTVATIQEMARLLDPPEDYTGELQRQLKPLQPHLFYAPNVTTDWYPFPAKWKARWDEGTRRMEQGMTTLSLRDAVLLDPELKPHQAGLVINFPIIQFVQPGSSGLVQTVTLPDSGVTLHYQHARYLGNRDTEPRIATAHRIRLGPQADHEFILINVHLATLNEENHPGPLRINRRPTPSAIALRHLQLDILRRFVGDVYRDLKLPVIVSGDFNAGPDALELAWFARQTQTRMVFQPDSGHCWKCGEPADPSRPRELFTLPETKSILTPSQEEFTAITGTEPARLEVPEWCARCEVPLFTHKRNFTLIDNIFHTSPEASAALGLRTTLHPTPDRGIRLDTCFSDHLPIWSVFNVS